jgi:hypothetical protein
MRGRALQFRDFSGGLNLRAGAYGLGENEAASVTNFRPTVRGSLKSRQGDTNILDFTDLGNQPMRSLSTVESLSAGTADDLLAGMEDGKLYRYTSGTTATLLGTFTASAVWDFIDAPTSGGQGPVYGVNGTVAKQITTAPVVADWTAATGTLPANAKYLAYVGNRVWAAGMSSYGAVVDPGSAVVFSQLGDPRDWPAENIVQFDPNDGEAITGIGEVGAGLIVFKQSKAWLVYDLDTGANRPLGVGVGCISHRSIVQTPQGTIWAGVKQVWISDGSSVRPLADDLVSATSTPGVETYLLPGKAIIAVYHEDRLQLAGETITDVGGGVYTTSQFLYEYDFVTKSWWAHSTRGGLLAGAQTDGTAPRLWAGGHSRLDRMFDSGVWLDAAGSNLLRLWLGPLHTLGSGRDRLRGVEVEGSGTFGIAASPDFGSALGSLTAREVRDESAMPSTGVRREADFRPFSSAQIVLYATGFDLFPTVAAIPGYVPSDIQLDAYTLYVTRRPG